jgi:hypothetical protein
MQRHDFPYRALDHPRRFKSFEKGGLFGSSRKKSPKRASKSQTGRESTLAIWQRANTTTTMADRTGLIRGTTKRAAINGIVFTTENVLKSIYIVAGT